jgi:hypothetical protein
MGVKLCLILKEESILRVSENRVLKRIFGPKRAEVIGSSHLSHWFLAHGFFCPEDGGDTFLRNFGSHEMYTAAHPRRRNSSFVQDCFQNNSQEIIRAKVQQSENTSSIVF